MQGLHHRSLIALLLAALAALSFPAAADRRPLGLAVATARPAPLESLRKLVLSAPPERLAGRADLLRGAKIGELLSAARSGKHGALSSRGLGRVVLSHQTGVRIPVALPTP